MKSAARSPCRPIDFSHFVPYERARTLGLVRRSHSRACTPVVVSASRRLTAGQRGGGRSPLPKACIFCHGGRERESVREFRLNARVIQWWCAAQDSPEVSTLRRDDNSRDRRENVYRAKAVREIAERDVPRWKDRARGKEKKRARRARDGERCERGGWLFESAGLRVPK